MSTFTKVIAVFLACLLILVGISNLLSDNDQEEHVAEVGKEVISLNEYKSLYQSYSNSTSSSETQKKFKYDLLNALIEQKLLLNLTNELGLEVGEESIKDHIKNTQYFQNDTGEFDKNKFNEMLNSLHITEEEYVLKLKIILPAIMFMTSLFKDSYPITYGKEIDAQIYKHRYQTRVVDIIKITKDAVISTSEPDNKTLLDFYEKNKSNFYYPEYRTAQYISIGPKYFEDQVKISDEEVENVIEQRALKDQRDALNLVFSTKEEAEKAKKMLIEDKRNFEQVALEFGKTGLEEIRINNITKDILPKNMQDIIFALKEGEISKILESSFGWHIIKIESVHQISHEDLIKLKVDIKSVLANQKSFEKVNDFINQANYKVYNGATIEEISNEYNLPMQTIGPVDANENSDDLISFIFSRGKDQKSYFKSVGDSIISVKITDIILPELQNFEESKSSVLELWRNKFITEKMSKIGQKIVGQIKDKAGADINGMQGIELLKEQQIHRNQQDYPFSFVEEIFNMKDIGSVTNFIKHDNAIIIGMLKGMHPSDGELNTMDTGKHVVMSLKEQLISYLESKYKVEVNHSILDDI